MNPWIFLHADDQRRDGALQFQHAADGPHIGPHGSLQLLGLALTPLNQPQRQERQHSVDGAERLPHSAEKLADILQAFELLGGLLRREQGRLPLAADRRAGILRLRGGGLPLRSRVLLRGGILLRSGVLLRGVLLVERVRSWSGSSGRRAPRQGRESPLANIQRPFEHHRPANARILGARRRRAGCCGGHLRQGLRAAAAGLAAKGLAAYWSEQARP